MASLAIFLKLQITVNLHNSKIEVMDRDRIHDGWILWWLSIAIFYFDNNIHYYSTEYTVGWGTKAQCFHPPYLKTWFFYVVFNAELNGTVRILCFCRAIIDLLWPSRAQLGHSRSIWQKHKILIVSFYSALKTT